MKNVCFSFWFSLFMAFIAVTLQAKASKDLLEPLTSELIPRQLFFSKQNIEDYAISDTAKLKRLIAKQKGWECIKLYYQSERKEGDLGIRCIFTNEDEIPRHLYYITPEKKIIQIDTPATFYASFEEALSETLFLRSSFISTNNSNRQYYLFDANTLKSKALEHPQNFTSIVFDLSLTPIVGIEAYSRGRQKIHIRTNDGEWDVIADKEDLQEAALTFIRPNPFTGEAIIVEGMKSSDGKFTNRLMTYHPNLGLRLLHEGVDDRAELTVSSVDIVPGVPLCAYSYVEQGKINWHMKDLIFQYVFSDFQDKLRYNLGHDAFTIEHLGQHDATHWIAEVSFDQEPNRSAVYDLAGKSVSWAPDSFHTSVIRNKKLSFVPYAYEEISAHDLFAIPTFIAQPSRGQGPFPTLVMVHGGPHDRYLLHFSPLVQLLVNRGMLVLIPNFRGSTVSPNVIAQSQGQWGKDMQKDLHSVIEWSITKGLADKSKIAFWGGSYGGYSTLLEAVSPYCSESFPGIRCAVAQCAISDLEGMLTSFYSEFGPRVDKLALLLLSEMGGKFGDMPDKIKESLKNASLLHMMPNKEIPLLIIHGEKDRRASPEHAYKMSNNLKEQNMPHTFITFHEADHEPDDPGIQLAYSALIENFLAKHLGTKREPFGEDLSYSSFIVHEGEELIQGLQEAQKKPSKFLHLRKGIKFFLFSLADQWLSDLIEHELNNLRTQNLKIVPFYRNYYRQLFLNLFTSGF